MKYARFIPWHCKSAHNITNELWNIHACFQIDYPPTHLSWGNKNANYKWPWISQGKLYLHLIWYAMAYLLACLEIHQQVIALPPWSPSTQVEIALKKSDFFSFNQDCSCILFYRGRKNKHKAKQRVSSNFMLYTAMWLEGFVCCKYSPLPMSASVCMQPKMWSVWEWAICAYKHGLIWVQRATSVVFLHPSQTLTGL